jgi:hypothetical protein
MLDDLFDAAPCFLMAIWSGGIADATMAIKETKKLDPGDRCEF